MALRHLAKLPGRVVSHTRWLLRDPENFFVSRDLKRHPEKLLGFEPMAPLHVMVDPAAGLEPCVNVLLPALNAGSLTGGPNTAIHLAIALARAGVPVRVVAVDDELPADLDPLRRHVRALAGSDEAPPNLTFASTFSSERPARFGARDTFLATLWTTAFRLKSILPQLARPEFLYLIQDFEPSFYPWSTSYAQATETYALPFRALINEQLLADYFVTTQTGLFAEAGFLGRCAVFEPAVDRRLFHPVAAPDGLRRLLFYARPNHLRNMFGIGLEALRQAVQQPGFAGAEWRFTSIGSTVPPTPLGGGRVLEPAPWLSYEDYAGLIRESDLLLCPMLSPHTSYPVLEMAACRGIAVTNTFGPKTQARLAAMSDGIVAGAPSIEGLRDALLAAVGQLGRTDRRPSSQPADWPTALAGAVAMAKRAYEEAAGLGG